MSGGPTGMSLVGIAMTVPTITFLLIGGVASDRFERRWLLVGADLLRAVALALLAGLTIGGQVELWHVVVLAALYGTGAAFHAPAFDALVPEILSGERLTQGQRAGPANAPAGAANWPSRRSARSSASPGPAVVFVLDCATFLMAAGTVLLMNPAHPPRGKREVAAGGSMVADLREGWRFVRGHSWLWATFASAAVAYLLFMGLVEVLLPWVVKEGMKGSAFDLGLVFAAGGLASMLCACCARPLRPAASGHHLHVDRLDAGDACGRRLRRGLGGLAALIASAIFNGLETAGTIVWATTKQRHVPGALLGRVSSLDWLISVGLLPLSFALTGPVSAAIGARETLIAAGLLGSIVTLAALYVPGMRVLDERAVRPRRAAAPWTSGWRGDPLSFRADR